MKESLECENMEEAVRRYWGKYKQRSKFEESYKEIDDYQKFLETIQ